MAHRRPRHYPQPDLALDVLRSSQPGVMAAESDQVSAPAHLHYPPLIQGDDVVSVRNRQESVNEDEYRTPLHGRCQGRLNVGLGVIFQRSHHCRAQALDDLARALALSRRAGAIATRWRWPPERWVPRGPTLVCHPSDTLPTPSAAFLSTRASRTRVCHLDVSTQVHARRHRSRLRTTRFS